MIKRNILDCMTLVGGTPSRYEGEKTYVSTGAVDCDHVDYAQAERVTYDNRPSRANLSVAEGDILFAKMCGTKKTLRIDRPLSEHLYSTGFCAVRANESIMDAALLYHLLASDQFLTQKDQNSSGATQKAITNAGLRKIVIQVPDLSEQRKLAANLDCIEQLMAKRREQLVSFDQLVKSRFVELFGVYPLNPKRWETATIRDIVTDVRYGSSRPAVDGGKYPYLRMNNITYGGELDLTDTKRIDIPDNELDKCTVRRGDVLFNRTNSKELVGKTCVYNRDEMMVLAGFVIRVRVTERILPEFLSAFLNTDFSKRMLLGMCKAAIGQANINAQEMQDIGIYLPPTELQRQFVQFKEQTDKSKLAVQKSLEELEILKKSLMQQYFG